MVNEGLEPDPSVEQGSSQTDESSEQELTDKLDRVAGGRTIKEEAPSVPRGPRGARAAALQALYEQDLTGHPAMAALENLNTYTRLSPSHARKAADLVEAVTARMNELDERIGAVAKEFPTEQLGAVDRNILRVALVELDPNSGVPEGVAVNEAVELARLFGSDSSPGFINGVLGALLR